jgi:hypothetical protein
MLKKMYILEDYRCHTLSRINVHKVLIDIMPPPGFAVIKKLVREEV